MQQIIIIIKGTVYPKSIIQWSFTQPHVVLNLNEFIFAAKQLCTMIL